jgi:ubiquitin carboxyl-terminal hydrolase L3
MYINPSLTRAPLTPRIASTSPHNMPKKWLPLEANPDVMNAFARALGLSPSYAFHDVYGFDDDVLDFVPKPCAAVLVLYPITPATEAVRGAIDGDEPDVPRELWYAKQTVSNACGTMGIIHAAMNAPATVVEEDNYFASLRARCEGLDADARANVIENDDALEVAHVGASTEGQSEVPDINANIDLHFVTFADVNGGLWELDGRKPGPVYHGPTSDAGLLKDSVPVIRKYMDAADGSIHFNVIALAANLDA